jgi:hypothetical protein
MNAIEPTLTIICATIGRSSLPGALASCCALDGRDELLVVVDGPMAVELGEARNWPFTRVVRLPDGPHHDWGSTAHSRGMRLARGDWLAWMDDDDAMTKEGIAHIKKRISEGPYVPHIFRQHYPIHGNIIWHEREVRCGNIGTGCLCIPNVSGKLGHHDGFHGEDYRFLLSTLEHYPEGPVWREEVIQHIWCSH